MTALPGWPYPAEVGGCVSAPAFILHCGDFVTAGGQGQVNLMHYLHCMGQTDVPVYETLGNHELFHAPVVEHFVEKYGGRHYSFERDGVHFVSLFQTFREDESVEKLEGAQLEWLERTLSTVGPEKPVVLFSHQRLDFLPNADELDSVLAKTKVILMLSGHRHNDISRYEWGGRIGVSIGHCRDHPADAIFGRRILVVRITEGQLAVVPWRWDLRQWACRQGWAEEAGEHFVKAL
jgi:hypothetical protein